MTKFSYGEQLKHPNWQRKRLEVMQAAEFRCERCGDGDTTLAVHHKEYTRGALAWEYAAHSLQCLCEHCHTTHHGKGLAPIGSASRRRDAWEQIAGFHLAACAMAADAGGMSKAEVERLARVVCEQAKADWFALHAELNAG